MARPSGGQTAAMNTPDLESVGSSDRHRWRADGCRLARTARPTRSMRSRLDLPAGCMVGLIGPDGVGKSSLLALIAGARRIQQGQVEVLGGDMADAGFRRAACPRIAYMPQGLGKNLLPDAVGLREHRLLRPAVRPQPCRGQAPHRRAAGQYRAGPLPGPTGRQAVRRHEAEAVPVLRPDPRPGPA